MAMLASLKRRREDYLNTHFDMADWVVNHFSGTNYSLWQVVQSVVPGHCIGRVLDAGAGRGAWRTAILRTATTYESVDLSARGEHRPTWEADICEMPVIPDARYDSVVCHQVLEHVRKPRAALAEMQRVLMPGGCLILSVPHLSRRHELPHDYFRYTQEGVRVLLEELDFEVVLLKPYGGLMTFLHHQTSLFFPGFVAGIPLLGRLGALLNAPLSRLTALLDALLDRPGLFANGIVAVARKPEAHARTAAARLPAGNG
jgi:SAM-dependent methyltransferase